MPAPVPIAHVVTNGAELLRRLRVTGTGETKLAPARKLLTDVHRVEKGRIATSEEVIGAMEAAGVSDATLAKAREIAETGAWAGPREVRERPIEDVLLGLPEAPVDLGGEKAADPEAAAEPAKPKAAKPKAADPNRPGVFPTAADGAFVGPKPVAAAK